MPVSSTDSIDIVANSVCLCDEDSVCTYLGHLLEENRRNPTDNRRPTRDAQHHPEVSRKHEQRRIIYPTITTQLGTKADSSDVNNALATI